MEIMSKNMKVQYKTFVGITNPAGLGEFALPRGPHNGAS
jgi:hypothetical protein